MSTEYGWYILWIFYMEYVKYIFWGGNNKFGARIIYFKQNICIMQYIFWAEYMHCAIYISSRIYALCNIYFEQNKCIMQHIFWAEYMHYAIYILSRIYALCNIYFEYIPEDIKYSLITLFSPSSLSKAISRITREPEM